MGNSQRRSWFRQLCGVLFLGVVLTMTLAQGAHALRLVAPAGLPPVEEPYWAYHIYLPAIGNN